MESAAPAREPGTVANKEVIEDTIESSKDYNRPIRKNFQKSPIKQAGTA